MITLTFACGHTMQATGNEQHPVCGCGESRIDHVKAAAPRFTGHALGPCARFENLPAKPDADRALISEVAMDIGKEAVSHLRTQYPDVFAAMNSGCRLSLRNCVHREIMAALDTTDVDEIRRRLERRRKYRRERHAAWERIRRTTPPDGGPDEI